SGNLRRHTPWRRRRRRGAGTSGESGARNAKSPAVARGLRGLRERRAAPSSAHRRTFLFLGEVWGVPSARGTVEKVPESSREREALSMAQRGGTRKPRPGHKAGSAAPCEVTATA